MSGQPSRLSEHGLIDRTQPLSFRFDGSPYRGFAGDTLASALLASGIRVVGRSFKYHRPRGILTAGSEEPNALVELRTGARREANTRATATELFDGLEARSQNRWPSLRFDVGSINSLFAPLFVAGFYYKTFMWPASFWEKVYEPLIRRAAGLGRASLEADPDAYEHSHAFCDILVVGAGPAGLAAALAGGRGGARVILCDEDFLLGGRLNGERHEIDGSSGVEWARHVEAELVSLPHVQVLRRTTVFGVHDDGPSGVRTFGALERVSDHLPMPGPHQPRQRLWHVRAKRCVLASGAIERPIVFGGNDRPGVMLASAVRTYLHRFAVVAGTRLAVFTNGDDGWKTAFDLHEAGVTVEAVVDSRPESSPSVMSKSRHLGMRTLMGARIAHASGAQGIHHVTARDGEGRSIRLRSDLLAVSGGWNPNLALSTHLGGRPQWSDEVSAFVPGTLPHGMCVAGAARGSFTVAAALREGFAAGQHAAQDTGSECTPAQRWRTHDEPTAVTPLWYVEGTTGKAFVDFQHDVTFDDIALAAREGYRAGELLKRYTTLGMGTDQGKTSSVNGQAVMAAITGRSLPQVGSPTARPPYTPVAIGALAGTHRGTDFKPTRLTAGHEWAKERGATFVEAGLWLRAQWFAIPGETDWRTTVDREVKAVRSGVGVCDVSTLGKIEIHGADAAVFLDRLYINLMSTLPIGKVRYGVMLREDGLVLDDGTAARLAADHYVISTTTANAAKVMQHLEHAHQVIWPDLDVQTLSVTEQWAQYAVAGPQSRALLRRLLGDFIDLSNAAFPYLACAEFEWRGVSVRLFRISFSGELAYELAVPARHGDAVIRLLMEAGEAWNVVPYGTEALGVMRIEKGHVGGNEINGTTTADDLGLGRMMSKKKDFIGRILSARPGLIAADRCVLVGIKPLAATSRLHSGAHLLKRGAQESLENDQGYITSVAFSPMLGHWIGLALLTHGRERWGERLRTYDPLQGGEAEVEVVSPAFFDPDGLRLHVNNTPWIARSAFLGGSLIGRSEAPVHRPGGGTIVIERHELRMATILVHKGQMESLTQRVRKHFDLDLPQGPRRQAAGGIAFAGMGPESWLATREQGSNAFACSLREALGDAACVCDQSDAYVALRLTGPQVRATLAKLVPMDVHARAFQINDVASTVASHIGATLWRLADAPDGSPVFVIAVFRSYAVDFQHLLNQAAAGALKGVIV